MALDYKYDKLLDEVREKDTGITFTGNAGDIFDDTGSDTSKGYTSGKISSELKALIKEYGSNGRIRYDAGIKHWFFEVLNQGAWVKKMEVGGSIIVDVIRLIKGEKPIVPQGEAAVYLREITLPDGSETIRWEFVLDNQKEYGIVVNDQQLDKVAYRRNDGALIYLPNIYKDKNDNSFEDIDEIKFINGTLTKVGETLNVSIDGGGSGGAVDSVAGKTGVVTLDANDISETSDKHWLTTAEKTKLAGMETGAEVNDNGAEIVSKINKELGSTDWQNGGFSPPSENFKAYAGFSNLDTIDETEVKTFSSSFINNPENTFSGTQTNPPSYFYIVMPQDKINTVRTVSIGSSPIGSSWNSGSITIDGNPYGYLKSPRTMYDQMQTFKTHK